MPVLLISQQIYSKTWALVYGIPRYVIIIDVYGDHSTFHDEIDYSRHALYCMHTRPILVNQVT